MATSKKKGDWWETFLWLGIFILAAVFIYQLLKLWNAGVATATNGFDAVGQALTNTATEAENFLTGLITAPATAIASLFNAIPDFLNLVINFASGLLTGTLITQLFGFVGSLFNGLFSLFGTIAPITTGQGSSYTGPGATPTPVVTPPSTITSFENGTTFSTSAGY